MKAYRRTNTITSGRFVHYTSADIALKIIRTKRLWMRNTTCMADYREVERGYQMLLNFFSDPAKRETFTAALDICAPGAATEAINLFDRCWAHIRFNTYISSIAEHEGGEDLHGRLSMWRTFGGTFARVALVFRIPLYSGGAEKLNFMAINTVIENIKAAADFLRTLDRQIVIAQVFNMLLAGVPRVKREGFEEEREWRAIYMPKRAASPLMISSTEVIGASPRSSSVCGCAREGRRYRCRQPSAHIRNSATSIRRIGCAGQELAHWRHSGGLSD